MLTMKPQECHVVFSQSQWFQGTMNHRSFIDAFRMSKTTTQVVLVAAVLTLLLWMLQAANTRGFRRQKCGFS
jgi:hypothetical protein